MGRGIDRNAFGSLQARTYRDATQRNATERKRHWYVRYRVRAGGMLCNLWAVLKTGRTLPGVTAVGGQLYVDVGSSWLMLLLHRKLLYELRVRELQA